MSEDTLPLSDVAVDWLETLLADGPQHGDDRPDGVVLFALRALGLIEHVGGGYYRITEDGVSALTFQVVRV